MLRYALALALLLAPAAYPQTVLLGGMDFDGGEVFVGGDFIDYGTGFNHFLTSDFAVSVDLSRLLSLADQTTHAILATADAGTATFVIQAEGPAGRRASPAPAGQRQLAPSVYWKFADLEIENLSASFGR